MVGGGFWLVVFLALFALVGAAVENHVARQQRKRADNAERKLERIAKYWELGYEFDEDLIDPPKEAWYG